MNKKKTPEKLKIAAGKWLSKEKNVQITPFVPLCHVYTQQFGHFLIERVFF
jgi:hypothetical protein